MPADSVLLTEALSSIIRSRRTVKPSFYESAPDPVQVRELIDTARHAPNHHRTEPARFYLLDSERIKKVGQLFGEVILENSSDDHAIKKAEKKTKEWGMAPGLLVITCHSDSASELAKRHPDVVEEDYATVSCICQNLLLLFESASISAKWSTGPVWKHPQFASTVGIKRPSVEKVVALIFYGFSQKTTDSRTLRNLDEHLVDHTR
jgi:nitroreductase